MVDVQPSARFCPSCGSPVSAGRFCANCGADLSGAPPDASPTHDASAVPQAVTRTVDWAGVVILVAGALAIVGTFLPWITVTAAFIGTIGRNGLDGGGDGIFTIILGLLIALMGVAILAESGSRNSARLGAVVLAVILLGIAALDIGGVNDRLKSLGSNAAIGSVGTGLIAIALAGVLAIIGSVLPGRAAKA
jgi:hypothetical protein